MDKQKILSEYKKQEDKILLAQVLDKIEFSKQREKLEYTDFLDMYQVALVKSFMKKMNLKIMFYMEVLKMLKEMYL